MFDHVVEAVRALRESGCDNPIQEVLKNRKLLDPAQAILGTDNLNEAFHTDVSKRVLDCEKDVREVSRQSVVAARGIAPGETITPEMITIKRPGTGILAYRLDEVVGGVAKRAIEHDVPIVEEDIR